MLVQIGLLPRDGLPVTGIEATQKLVNERLPSNLLMKNCLFRRLDAPPFPGEGARKNRTRYQQNAGLVRSRVMPFLTIARSNKQSRSPRGSIVCWYSCAL